MTLQTVGEDGPFQPAADGEGRKPGPLLIGCGALLALLGVAVLLFMVRGEGWIRGIVAWSLGTVENEVTGALPTELTGEERARLLAAFAAARASIRESEEIDVGALQALQPVLLDVSRAVAADALTRQQCRKLTAALERLAAAPGERGRRFPTRDSAAYDSSVSSSEPRVFGVSAASPFSSSGDCGASLRPPSQPAMCWATQSSSSSPDGKTAAGWGLG